jgi:hypothetical protein
MREHKKENGAAPRMDAPTRKKLGTIWYLIGLAWQCGDGLDENERLAINSFHRAAGYGNAEAMRCLADFYFYRDRDLMKAMAWWLHAIEADRSSSGQEEMESETVRRYREAAARGCAGAQARLGECCFRGDDVKRNRREGVKWFRRAAAQGSARAMLGLGICYLFGCCVKKNEAKAFRLWMRSAALGFAEAQYYVALCYEQGDLVKQDRDEALKWLRLAAAQGHRDALAELESRN